MPVRTPHFGLEAFITGDIYSSSVDKRRFTIIDSNMAFISELVGQGKIKGWDLSIPSSYTLMVSSGWGMIDRSIVRTFGDFNKSLLDNSTVYVWMRNRPGVIGQISAFSNISTINYIDSTAPSNPISLSIVSKSTDSINIQWSSSSEIDFNYYEVYRSTDNISYSLINKVYLNEFTDTGLSENSIYYYKIKSYDLSENSSSFSSFLLAITDKDLSKPANPSSVKIINSKNSVHVIWNKAPYGNISNYRAYVTPVNEEKIAIDSEFVVNSSEDSADMTIKNLVNEQRYLIVLKSVSARGIESDGVSLLGIPVDTGGPLDVSEITIIDYVVESGISTNGMNISWISEIDPYSYFNGISEILIEEYRNDGTVLTSEWIPTLSGYQTRSIEVFPYKKNGQSFYKSIESRTIYYVTIRNVDSNGIKSVGKRVRHYTKNFLSPDPARFLSITDNPDKTLVFKWENSSSIFSYNLISVKKTDLSDSSDTFLFTQKNVGKSTFFSLDPSFSKENNRYTFSIICVDEFENESILSSIVYETSVLVNLPKPPQPAQQIGFAGDKQNIINWSASSSKDVKGYKIYRSLDSVSLDASAFSLLETVPANIYSYIDYEVENNSSYIYFVTTLNLYDQESLNPIDDKYINYSLITLKPTSNSLLNPPINLSSTIIGNSVQISWQPTGGQFDGYEIYKSIGNKYSFVLIATVSPSVTYYVDYLSLIYTGNVYYMVRKFKNESDLFITESSVNVTNAVYLGKVTTSSGVSSINLSNVRNISLLEDPVREETKSRINVHKHEFVDDNNDKRINLDNKLVVSDWESNDNQIYTTITDISDTTTYIVYINGEESSSFGILYSLNKDTGTLVFETKLSATGFEIDGSQVFAFSEPPSITVEFGNLEETQNIIPEKRLKSLSSSQVSVGKLKNPQINLLNHDGRLREKIEPIQISTIKIDDGYRYAPFDSNEIIGDAVVFYDIMQAAGDLDILLASTSDGIYTSEDFGISWNRRFEPVTPVIKFFYSTKYDTYFAGTNRGILFGRGGSAGGFSIWTEITGTENAKIIRDIAEDQNGEIFCSSDLGVYKLRRDIGQGSFIFQQTPILGPRSTESYSILLDSNRGRLITSNELGIFESHNSGVLWSFSQEFPEQRPIHSFVEKNGFIYAITDYMLWRRGPSDSSFERIGVIESSIMARKISIWNNRIYISSDKGLFVTNSSNNIFSDTSVSFELAFSGFKINSTALPATSLNVIDNKLFVGSEDRLFLSNSPGKISLHSEFRSVVIPTIYINGEIQYIGYRFTTSLDRLRKYVCFDVKQKFGNVVTIANQYKKFKIKNGGWADANYLSSVSLFVDGIKMNSMSLSEKPAQEVSQIILPSYSDRNAHKSGADLAKTKFEISKSNLLEVERNDAGQISKLKGFSKDNVVSTLYGIERFLSQLYETARVIEITDEQGKVSEIPFKIPDFRVILLTPESNKNAIKISNFGSYKSWSSNQNNSQSSVIGHFGSELTSDGNVPVELIGGLGDLGSMGG